MQEELVEERKLRKRAEKHQVKLERDLTKKQDVVADLLRQQKAHQFFAEAQSNYEKVVNKYQPNVVCCLFAFCLFFVVDCFFLILF